MTKWLLCKIFPFSIPISFVIEMHIIVISNFDGAWKPHFAVHCCATFSQCCSDSEQVFIWKWSQIYSVITYNLYMLSLSLVSVFIIIIIIVVCFLLTLKIKHIYYRLCCYCLLSLFCWIRQEQILRGWFDDDFLYFFVLTYDFDGTTAFAKYCTICLQDKWYNTLRPCKRYYKDYSNQSVVPKPNESGWVMRSSKICFVLVIFLTNDIINIIQI